MSSTAHASVSDIAGNEPEKSKVRIFVQVAVILAVITAIEIGVIFLPAASWVRAGILFALSIVKFLLVIFVFMHLHWDRLFCTILFFIGLSLAGGTVAALLAVFRGKDSVPLTSRTVMVEKEAGSEKWEARMAPKTPNHGRIAALI